MKTFLSNLFNIRSKKMGVAATHKHTYDWTAFSCTSFLLWWVDMPYQARFNFRIALTASLSCFSVANSACESNSMVCNLVSKSATRWYNCPSRSFIYRWVRHCENSHRTFAQVAAENDSVSCSYWASGLNLSSCGTWGCCCCCDCCFTL